MAKDTEYSDIQKWLKAPENLKDTRDKTEQAMLNAFPHPSDTAKDHAAKELNKIYNPNLPTLTAKAELTAKDKKIVEDDKVRDQKVKNHVEDLINEANKLIREINQLASGRKSEDTKKNSQENEALKQKIDQLRKLWDGDQGLTQSGLCHMVDGDNGNQFRSALEDLERKNSNMRFRSLRRGGRPKKVDDTKKTLMYDSENGEIASLDRNGKKTTLTATINGSEENVKFTKKEKDELIKRWKEQNPGKPVKIRKKGKFSHRITFNNVHDKQSFLQFACEQYKANKQKALNDQKEQGASVSARPEQTKAEKPLLSAELKLDSKTTTHISDLRQESKSSEPPSSTP